MKRLLLAVALLIATTLVAACAPTYYGVPEDRWRGMSERERLEAMRHYQERERTEQQAAAERARREAIARERERARQEEAERRERAVRAEEERRQRERIEAIHRGQGAYGELVRVRLQGGEMRIGATHHRYRPITFTIADGESREILVTDDGGRGANLIVTYAGGSLIVDSGRGFRGSDLRLPYDRRWGEGALYPETSTDGPLQLRGVDIAVDIPDTRRGEWRQPRQVIVLPGHERRRQVAPEPEKPRPLPPGRPEERRPEPPRHAPPVEHERKPERLGPPSRVEIAFLKGEIKAKGRHYAIEPFSLRLKDGEVKEATFKVAGEERSITLAYRNGGIVIDANPRDAKSDAAIPFERDWYRGKVYQVETKGRVHLEHAEVRVSAAADAR